MAATATQTREFGWKAADFDLEGTDGKRYGLADVSGPNGLVVMFICNHCPYVKAVIDDMVRDCRTLAAEGIGSIAVMSNDTAAYPADSFDNMKQFAAAHRFAFPYVIDRSQAVARKYEAVCTPDLYGFDRDLALRYRGRLMEMAGLKPVTGGRHDLVEAMRQIAATGKGPADQTPSIGCSIKWRE